MRTIGLLGGMSWQSTQEYYRLINEETMRRLGALHSAPLVLHSVDFAEIKAMQDCGDWKAAARRLQQGARSVEQAGADMLVLCTNTMHRLADEIQSVISIPLIHSFEATAIALKAAGIKKTGLLGTRFTMREGFFRDYLSDHHGIETIVPSAEEQTLVDRVIYEELCAGDIRHQSRTAFRHIILGMARQGADATILGCTEIGLLIGKDDIDVPLFDTTEIHAIAALEEAMRGEEKKQCSQAS